VPEGRLGSISCASHLAVAARCSEDWLGTVSLSSGSRVGEATRVRAGCEAGEVVRFVSRPAVLAVFRRAAGLSMRSSRCRCLLGPIGAIAVDVSRAAGFPCGDEFPTARLSDHRVRVPVTLLVKTVVVGFSEPSKVKLHFSCLWTPVPPAHLPLPV
jgi:hypothetical protein